MPFNKPPELPRWATGAAVMSEPPETTKDVGFVPGNQAAAAHMNWLLNQLYLWAQYLDDPATFAAQALVAGGLTINSPGTITTPTITTTGAATVGGALTASGGLTVPPGQTAALQGNATVGGTLGVTGATTLGGALGVTGALTASGGLTVPAGQAATVQGNATVAGTLGVTGATTVGSLTAAANQHVTVSGTGDYKHGDRTLQLPASAGTPVNTSDGQSGFPATGSTGWKYMRSTAIFAQFWHTPGASGNEVVFPVVLDVGHRIKSISARVQDTSGGHSISMYLHRTAVTTSFLSGSVAVGTQQTSAGNGTVQTLTMSGLTQVINSFELYNVVLRANGSSFTNHRIAGVQVIYDRP